MCKSIMRRLGVGFLAFCVSFALFVPPIPVHGANALKDIRGHWAESYILQAVQAGIVNGYPNGGFLPNQGVSRAEFIHMINATLKNSAVTSVSFRDVSPSQWYYNAVRTAVAAGYVSGYSDRTFKPDAIITRQEAAVILANVVPTYGAGGNLRSYPDYRQIESWAAPALEKITGRGYLGAYGDGKLHPLDKLTRGQAAKIICDILNKETIISNTPEITRDGTNLSGKIYSNGITIGKSLGSGSATINNCVVLGTLSVLGGGENTITIANSRVINASVARSSDTVRVLLKGETNVLKADVSNSAKLETSGLTYTNFGPGFSRINVQRNAAVLFSGNFREILLDGSGIEATFITGTTDKLQVSASGKQADITVESAATLTDSVVDAEAYFHGNGTIRNMTINANDVTYSKKPLTVTVGRNVNAPDTAGDGEIVVSPSNRQKNVALDTTITLTFDSAMTLYNGKSITSSNIDDFVELRKSSSNGSTVSYYASINSSRKVITLTPYSDLTEDTRYYVSIDKNELADSRDNGNSSFSSYFDTGNSSSGYATYYPRSGAGSVSVSINPTIKFSEKVVDYNGDSISTSKDLYRLLTFRKGGSNGSSVSFSAYIDSARREITVQPDSKLEQNTKYYLSVDSKSFKTYADSTSVPSSSVTWTTAGSSTPVTNDVTVSSTENTVTATVYANSYSGSTATAYCVLLPAGSSAPTAAQIVDRTVSGGMFQNSSISSGGSRSFTFGSLANNTGYRVHAVIRNTDATSAVRSSATISTKAPVVPTAVLTKLSSATGPLSPAFSGGTTAYTLTVPFGTTEVVLDAAMNAGTLICTQDDGKILQTASNTLSQTLSLPADATSSKVQLQIVSTQTLLPNTYTVTIQVAGETGITGIAVNGENATPNGTNFKYIAIIPQTSQAAIKVTPVDKGATVKVNGSTNTTVTLTDPLSEVKITVISNGQEKDYTLTIVQQPPTPPAPPAPPAPPTPPAP